MEKERKTVGALALDQVPRVIAIPPVSQEQTRKLRIPELIKNWPHPFLMFNDIGFRNAQYWCGNYKINRHL